MIVGEAFSLLLKIFLNIHVPKLYLPYSSSFYIPSFINIKINIKSPCQPQILKYLIPIYFYQRLGSSKHSIAVVTSVHLRYVFILLRLLFSNLFSGANNDCTQTFLFVSISQIEMGAL